MNLFLATWKCIMVLLCFSIKDHPLLPAECVDIIPLGHLTAEPATLFPIGSNLTVYCHVFKCQHRSKIYLELNKQNVNQSKRVNCTTTIFYLPRVWTPRSEVVCTLKSSQLSAPQVINGLDLHAGIPPDNPEVISCEATRSSDLINCSLNRGRETYLHTFYNISVHRADKLILDFNQDGEEFSIPRAMLEENTKYTLTATAYNHFGASRSGPFIFSVADIAIPETPHIVRVEFTNESTSAMIHWKTSVSSMLLRAQIRLRANNTWEQKEGAKISEGLIRVDNLRPLTEYEFQIKTCAPLSGQTHNITPSFNHGQRSLCSKWSPSVRKKSPGKGPSQELHVWRTIGDRGKRGLRKITVYWKPPPYDDYTGELLWYRVLLDNGHEVICAAASSQCSVQAPLEVLALNVSAVNSYGTSPPAFVDLRHAGGSESFLVKLAPAADGSTVHVSWSSTVSRDLLYLVLQWESVPAGRLQWKKVIKDVKDTTITGLISGVRYNVSLYAVTTRGVSSPASRLTYSREEKPLSAPVFRVLIHEARRILVQWDELPLEQQRGFITKSTIYLQTLDPSIKELSVTVSGPGQRQMWLDCPKEALTLELSASNSAGEGPRGRKMLSAGQPADPAVRLVLVIVFIIIIFIAIVANLMCWSCVRKRIKQKCIAWGPEWLVDNLPKPGHSNAIRLLEDDRSEPLFFSTYSDPPLSPILVISQEEKDEVYPTIHVEEFLIGSKQANPETDLTMSDTRTVPAEPTGYKPQIATLIPFDEDKRDVPENTDEDKDWIEIEGLLRGFRCNMDVDCSDLSLGSIGDHFHPKNAEMSALKGVCLQEMCTKDDDAENSASFLDMQEDQTQTLDSDDICSSPFSASPVLNSGYFPQVASLSTVTLDTLR